MEWESAKFTIHKKGSVKINHVQTDKHWKDRPVIPNRLRKSSEEF